MKGDAEYEVIDGDVTPTHALSFEDGQLVLAWIDKDSNELRLNVNGEAVRLFHQHHP